MPLVQPLPIDATPEVASLTGLFQQTLGFTPNSVLTMQHRPEVAMALIRLNGAVMQNHGRITAEQKRLIGYLASTASGCRYCQAHTAHAAQRFGATDERVQGVWEYHTNPLFTDAERTAFELAVAAGSSPNAVTEEMIIDARKHWDDGELVEIVAVISLFGFLTRWNDTMGTTLEDEALYTCERLLAADGWTVGKHVRPSTGA